MTIWPNCLCYNNTSAGRVERIFRAMRDQLKSAIALHRSGKFVAASQLYHQVLARQQGNAEAWHWLGVLHHQQGDHARAVESIVRAISLRPGSFLYHANLAEAYRALGDPERAVECCRASLAIWPDNPEVLCNVGLA